jgi:hypothetical protein
VKHELTTGDDKEGVVPAVPLALDGDETGGLSVEEEEDVVVDEQLVVLIEVVVNGGAGESGRAGLTDNTGAEEAVRAGCVFFFLA